MSERGQPGRIVDGRFELLERLGSGGMGTVWRARDVGLHREVAIKEVRPADAAALENNPALAAQLRERVLRESRALARLQHPNVVSIYQIIETPDSPFPWIVMELVRGTSLDARLQQGSIPAAETARIGRDVLAALRSAHAAGIMHRDVKPGNVLLRTDGSAVLTDFGIAALHGSTQLTATGDVIGSPEYIAPERLRGDETQTASDLWSLAMLLYVAVEGYNPMRRASTMATLAAVMTEPVPPPQRAGALTPALRAVLVPDPAARPTGEVLDRMLAAVEHGAPVPLGPPTPAGPAIPAQHSGPQHSGPRYGEPYPSFTPEPMSIPHSRPSRARSRVTAMVISYSVSAVIVIAAVTFLLNRMNDANGNPSDTDAGSRGTQITTIPDINVPDDPTTTTADAPKTENLLTPAGAREVVAALAKVMGGKKVSDLTIYPDFATATAPAKSVKNGFDDFTYRDGAATRDGPDTVDADRAVLNLDEVNWDALPALWQRAEKDLGVAKPTSRYIVVDTDIIDGHPEFKLYLSDDYGGAYLLANLKGEVVDLYPRDS